ncbi:hypothetical protein N9U60_03930, partial [Betaproteobacteria bacterium]|nr:hypothetical protein [Betaproteobacteria bacterium]
DVYGGAGSDVLIDLEGGDALYGDRNKGESTSATQDRDYFVVGDSAIVRDLDLSPDGTGLSGRSNQAQDIVYVQVTAASLAAAGYRLSEIYELASGDPAYESKWRDFVKTLEVEVTPDTQNDTYEIDLRIDGDGDPNTVTNSIGVISFDEANGGSGNYNAVKLLNNKFKLDEILKQFDSEAGESNNAHVLEQFFGMDALTAAEITQLEHAMDAGEDEQAQSTSTISSVIAAIEAELPATGSSQSFEAAEQLLAVLNQQQSVATTTTEVIAAAQEVVDDVIDEALAATDMDTSVFVPIAVEEIREGTIRTEVIEDRTEHLATIRAIADQQAQDEKREELLGKTTVVDREPDTTQPAGDPAP